MRVSSAASGGFVEVEWSLEPGKIFAGAVDGAGAVPLIIKRDFVKRREMVMAVVVVSAAAIVFGEQCPAWS